MPNQKLTTAQKKARREKMATNVAMKELGRKEVVAGMTSYEANGPVAQQPTISDLTDSIASLVDIVKPLVGAVADLQKSQGKIPRTETPEQRIAEVNARSVARQAAQSPDRQASGHTLVDLRNPTAHLEGFQADDVVRLRDDSPKKALIRSSNLFSPDWDGQGVIRSYMGVNHKGEPKYKCFFPRVGQDGILMSELELV